MELTAHPYIVPWPLAWEHPRRSGAKRWRGEDVKLIVVAASTKTMCSRRVILRDEIASFVLSRVGHLMKRSCQISGFDQTCPGTAVARAPRQKSLAETDLPGCHLLHIDARGLPTLYNNFNVHNIVIYIYICIHMYIYI